MLYFVLYKSNSGFVAFSGDDAHNQTSYKLYDYLSPACAQYAHVAWRKARAWPVHIAHTHSPVDDIGMTNEILFVCKAEITVYLIRYMKVMNIEH